MCVCVPLASRCSCPDTRKEWRTDENETLGPFVLAARPARQKQRRRRRRVKPLSVIPTRRAAYLDANIITRHACTQWGNKLRRTSLFSFLFFFTFLSASFFLHRLLSYSPHPSFEIDSSSLFNSTFSVSCARRAVRIVTVFVDSTGTVSAFCFHSFLRRGRLLFKLCFATACHVSS